MEKTWEGVNVLRGGWTKETGDVTYRAKRVDSDGKIKKECFLPRIRAGGKLKNNVRRVDKRTAPDEARWEKHSRRIRRDSDG